MKPNHRSNINFWKAFRTTAIAALLLVTAAAGANAAGYSLLDSVSALLGLSAPENIARLENAPSGGRTLQITGNNFFLTGYKPISSLSFFAPSYTTPGAAITQNFNSMGTSATASLPTDWRFGQTTDYASGVTAATTSGGTSGTGVLTSSSAGGYYNFASGVTGSATDRSPGWLASSGFTSPRQLFVKLTNTTGVTIGSVDIAYDIEKYKSGSRAFTINFFTSTDGTTWTARTAGDQSYAADANSTTVFNPPTSITKSFTLNGLSIPNGGDLYLRWAYTGTGGSTNAQALGIDNFSFTPYTAVPGTVEFSSASYSGLEGASGTVTVNRVGGTLGAISVNYATGGGNATAGAACTAGVDYISASGTLNWADGDSAAKTFNVQLCADALIETENFDLTLSAPSGTTITGTNPATFNITDNFPGTIQLTAATFNGNEGTNATITASRTGGSAGAVSVDYSFMGVTATGGASCSAGVDFISTPGTLTWANGDTANKTISVTLCTDTITYEGPETATLTLSNPQGSATLGSQTSATLTINDVGAVFSNSSPISIPMIGVASPYPSNINVAGMPGAISTVRVTLSNFTHSYMSDVDVLLVSPGGQKFILMSDVGASGNVSNRTYTLADSAAGFMSTSSAVAAGTYKPTNLGNGDAFAAPAPDAPYSSPAPDGTDTLNGVFGGGDPNGTWSLYVVDAFSPDGGGINGGWSLQIQTTAPGPGTIQFSSPTYSGGEGSTATITAKRVAGNVGAISADYSTSNGTATGGASCSAGIDYVNTSGTLNWADGDVSNKTFTVQLCADTLTAEPTETVSLTLSNPIGTTITGTNPATLSIINSSIGGSSFSNHAAITIPDAGSASPYPSTITVSGMGGSISNMAVTLNNLTHTYTSDITVLLVGPQGQNFVPMAGTGSSTASSNVTLQLYDDAAANMPEGALSSGPYKPTAIYATGDLPAPAPGNPYSNPGPVGGSTFTSIFGGTDPNGTWSLYVYDQAGPDNGSFAGGWDLEIASAKTVRFQNSIYNTTENAGTVMVNVVRDSVADPMTVDFATSPGASYPATGGASCGAGIDYVNTSGTISFAIGEATKPISVTLCDDAVFDGLKTIKVTLSNPSGDFTIGGGGQATINVVDDEPAPTISIDDVTVNEGAGNAVFTVTQSFATTVDTQFYYSTGDVTATAGSDYTGATNVLVTIPATQTTATVTVPITQDNAFENTETFTVTIFNSINATIVKAVGTGTILDDDVAAQYLVNSTNNTNDGTCNAAHCSLREAIIASNTTPGIISFSPGLTGTITFTASRPQITNNTIINGPGANLITVSGNNVIDVFSIPFTTTEVTIRGITITGGRNVNFGNAGAITSSGKLTIDKTVITGNTGSEAGGIETFGNLTVLNSTLSNNTGGRPSGGCSTTAGGIGASDDNAVVNIVNTTISGNTATGCSNNGGGITIYSGIVTISNSTIANNTSGASSSAAVINGSATVMKVRNSIIAGNVSNTTIPDVLGSFVSEGFNLIGNKGGVTVFSQATDQTGSGASPLDPMIAALANNGGTTSTHKLLAGSSAIDKGNSFGLTTDQRGAARPIDDLSIPNASDGSDIGAYELSNPVISITGGPFSFANTAPGEFSAEQFYTVNGSGLENGITVTAPANFQVSATSGTGFGPAVTLPQVSGFVVNAPVYVRFAPATTGLKSGNVTNTSPNAVTQNVAVSGTGTASPGTVRFTSAAYSSNETNADHVVNIPVSRILGTAGAITVDYAVTDGTATIADNDYAVTPATGTLMWADNDTADKTISVTVKGDLTVEPDETVNLTLSNPTGGAVLGSPAAAVLTIINDDTPPGAYVVNSNNDVNDGSCNAAHCSLREAINAVNAHYGEITFAPNVTGEIVLLSPLPGIDTLSATITGPGAGNLTIRPDNSLTDLRILEISGPTSFAVSGLTLSHGTPTFGGGGGLLAYGTGDVSITACTFTDHVSSSGSGGAVHHNGDGLMTISDSTFTNNQAALGGAVTSDGYGPMTISNTNFSTSHADTGGTLHHVSPGMMTITGCVINGSTATYQGAGINNAVSSPMTITDTRISSAFAGNAGGALSNSDGAVSITRSTFSGNSATSVGGGIFNDTGSINITASTISGNSVTSGNGADGGGVYNNSTGTINIANSTISGNSSSGVAGGIFFWANGVGHTTITGSTITGNTSRFYAGVFFDTGTDATIKNTIIAGNIASEFYPDIYGSAVSNGYNLIGNNQGLTMTPATGDQIGTAVTPINAMLGPLANNGGPTLTHELLAGSPAIDAGNAFGLATDQRGLTRPVDRAPANASDGADIGAFEAQAPPPPQISIDDVVFTGDSLAPNAFTVSLSSASEQTVTVHYATADDTAIAGEDYTATSGTLTFAPGETEKTIPVTILPDTINEPTEQFFLNLDMPVNATILDGQGIGTIPNDDPDPSFSIDDVTHAEGDSGTTAFTFTITKTGSTAQTASVDYATINGSAVSPSDFTATSGNLSFAPGDTTKTVTVFVNGDTNFEATETFILRLANPVNAYLTDGDGVGTIENDDTPQIITVNVNDDTDDGTCDASNCSLREAINLANSIGGQINFAPNVTGSISLLSALPTISNGDAIVIDGPGAGVLAVKRDASISALRIFDISGGGNYTIKGLAINDGDVRPIGGAFNNLGGAIRILSSRGVTIDNCTFTNNWANNGAAIYNGTNTGTGPLTVNNTTFTANNAGSGGGGIENRFSNPLTVNGSTFDANGANNFGGGIHNIASGVVFISDSVFTGNVANTGAGVNNDDTGSLTIRRSVISGNHGVVGGGISNKNGGLDVFNSTISGNTASEGAGAYNHIATMNFYNSTISGNTATSIGGGIYFTFQGQSNGTLQNCTITGNQGPNGGGVMVFNGSSVVRAGNTILAGNTGSQGPDLYGTIYSSGYNILGTTGGSYANFVATTGDQVGQFSVINPLLGPLADNGGPTMTRLPLTGSPAIDAGNAFGETADQRGFARTVNGATDIGAVEIQNAPAQIATFSGTPQSAFLGDNYVPVQARVTDVNGDPVGGITVTFSNPSGGPSALFPGGFFDATAVTDGNGVATAPVMTAYQAAGYFETTVRYAPNPAPYAFFAMTNVARPGISIDDVTFTGANSLVPEGFTVTLSAPSTGIVTVHYQTADGTAIAGEDYTAVNDTLTFAPGETSKIIPITILPDNIQEDTEQFYLNLDSPSSNAVIVDGQGVGTIPNDDAPPSFAIDDVTQNEGDAGTTSFTFTVTKTGSTTLGSTINYATHDGTAFDGSDYTGVSGMLTFQPGDVTKQVTVLVNGDTTYEATETFTVDLSTPTNATVTDAQGVGTITNDDAPPTFSIDNVIQNEGNAGTTNFVFTVIKSGTSELPSSVQFATQDGTATVADGDYLSNSGTLNFSAADTAKQIIVVVNGDLVYENNETFTVELSTPGGATIASGTGTGTITNDDTAPSFAVDDVTHNEGDSGTTSYIFTVTRTGSTAFTTSVDYGTVDGNATVADGDFLANNGTLTFLPGDSSQTITVLVNGDTKFEDDEQFFVHLTGPVGASISDDSGLGSITNDDAAPAFSIDDVTQNEGNTGTTAFTFTVTKTGTTDFASSVQFETQDGSATLADGDYQSNTGTLNFLATDTSKEITVLVNANYLVEPDEAFTVNLSNPTMATISDDQGIGTILNDDVTPTATYVDDDWTAVNIGDDPDGAGPALAFGYDAFRTIQEGIDAVAASGTVHVYNGTYNEDVNINNPGVKLLGESSSGTSINGPFGGPGSTVQVSANNVEVAGFTITRVGNNTTDWNNPNLNTAGINIQGQTTIGAVIHDNVLTGNRTAININNSNGHTVRNNVIDFNYTGLIFRNQTDNMTVVENFITNNWGIGILFLDGSGGTNSPQQSALGGTFSNNNISGNWYGQIADRQAGGSLPVPGTTNLKNFKGNWYGSTLPVVTTANTAEPGYAALIPVAYGGTAVIPGGQPDIAGPASANFQYEPQLLSGTDTDVETTPGRGTFGFQGVPNVPTLRIEDHTFNGADSLTEGAAQGFTVTLTGDTDQIVTVHYQTSDDTAIAGEDYDAASGTLTFNPGETSKVIPVNILPDTVQEPTEQFFIDLDTPVNAGILTGHATGTIPNDDAAPSFSIDNVTHSEGDSGITNYVFTVTKTGATALPSSVDFATQNDSASTPEGDFQATAGTLNFGPGDTTMQITVQVNGDVIFENDEQFEVVLSNPVNASITNGTGTGTILNDDAAPTISIDNVTHAEGNSGGTMYTFTVTKTGATAFNGGFDYNTVDGTATAAGGDYQASSGNVSMLAGETSKTITITVNGDNTYESDEAFTVHLSNAGGLTIAGADGTGTITNDDAPPTLSIDDHTFTGADSVIVDGFTVALTGATEVPATVHYQTADDTAIAGEDYTATSGTLTFLPGGPTTQTIPVAILPDNRQEDTEQFFMNLDMPVDATISDGHAVGIIPNDDAAPSFSIDNVTQSESSGGFTTFVFFVTKTGETALPSSVDYDTQPGTATAGVTCGPGVDYESRSGTLNFAAGDTTKQVLVNVCGDTVVEPDETFTVHLSNAVNGSITNADGLGTIQNDTTPAVSFASASYLEDESQTAVITLIRTGDTSGPSTVTFSTSNGTAIGGAACGPVGVDYATRSVNVTFAPTETTQTVDVPICADSLFETNFETVNLTLSSPVGTTVLGTPSAAVLNINDTASQHMNVSPITIANGGIADPYPSTINVTGAPSVAGTMRITLFDLAHDRPEDLEILLVAPNGQNLVLMAQAGGANALTGNGVTLTFDDAAGAVLPDSGVIMTRKYEPTNWGPVTNFPAPAPMGPYILPGSSLGGTVNLNSVFGAGPANGTWSLYIRDTGSPLATLAAGRIAGGWGLQFLAPTTASASISGRVTTATGNGIRNATVRISGGDLQQPVIVQTGSLGFYQFSDLHAGTTYFVTVSAKRFRFSEPTRAVTLQDNITDLDFLANPQ